MNTILLRYTFVLILGCVFASAAEKPAAPDLPSRQQMLGWLESGKFADLENGGKAWQTNEQKRQIIAERPSELRAFYEENYKRAESWEPTRSQIWLDQLTQWNKQFSNSACAKIALACFYQGMAWRVRGTGYANTVSDAQWEYFNTRMVRAHTLFEEAEKLPNKISYIYTKLLASARSTGWPRSEADKLFKRATNAFPDSINIYRERAFSLLPRWGGEDGEWLAFLKGVADERGDVGAMIYAISVDSLRRIEWQTTYQDKNFSYPLAKRGFTAALKIAPENRLILNQYCSFACYMKDMATAAELFEKIGDNVEVEVWISMGNFKIFREEARKKQQEQTPKPLPK